MINAILDHKVEKKIERTNINHGKGSCNITSTDTHSALSAHAILKENNGNIETKVLRKHYDIMPNGAIKEGVTDSIVAA